MTHDHDAAKETAAMLLATHEYPTNLAACYLDICKQHEELRRLAEEVHKCRIAQEYASRADWLASTENFIAALNKLRTYLETK